MGFVVQLPSPPLARYVDFLWHADLRAPYRQERILPMGTADLIVNFGGPFRLYDRDDPSRFTVWSESWLVGLQTAYLINEPLAETRMIGARFKPGGAYPFFRLPASDLHNRVAPGDALWGSFAAEARERLYDAPSIPGRFALLERLLLVRLNDVDYRLNAVQFAAGEIVRQWGALSIKTLSDHIGMSQKHLASQFGELVGVSPKALARIYRFQQVLNSIDPARPVNWAAVAQTAQYYDQAHFNHDFAAFTGLSPSDYLRLRREFLGNSLAQGQDVHFVPIG